MVSTERGRETERQKDGETQRNREIDADTDGLDRALGRLMETG